MTPVDVRSLTNCKQTLFSCTCDAMRGSEHEENLTPYELERLQRIAANKRVFQDLGLDSQAFDAALNQTKKKRVEGAAAAAKPKAPKGSVAQRRSRRCQGIEAELPDGMQHLSSAAATTSSDAPHFRAQKSIVTVSTSNLDAEELQQLNEHR